MKRSKPSEEQLRSVAWTTVFRTQADAVSAGIRVIARVNTGLPDDGILASGIRFVDLRALRDSPAQVIEAVRDKAMANRNGHGTGLAEVWDLFCDRKVQFFPAQSKIPVLAGKRKEHSCAIVGFGGHGSGASYPQDHADGREEAAPDGDKGAAPAMDALEPGTEPPASLSRYVPAVIERDGYVNYHVDMRLFDAKTSTRGKAATTEHEGFVLGHTCRYMPQEQLVIHTLHRSGLLRHLPNEDRRVARNQERFIESLKTSSINGVAASRLLHFCVLGAKAADWTQFKGLVPTLAGSDDSLAIVVGEVNESPIYLPGESTILSFAHLPELLPLEGGVDYRDVARLSSRVNACRAGAYGPMRVLAIALVRIGPGGAASIARLGSILMTGAYVFVESLGEALESNSMAAAGVDHEKFIRVFAGYGFIPDFVIYGYKYPVLMERWGLLLSHYREHMTKKVAAAQGKFPLVQSDVKFGRLGRPSYPAAILDAIREHELQLKAPRLPPGDVFSDRVFDQTIKPLQAPGKPPEVAAEATSEKSSLTQVIHGQRSSTGMSRHSEPPLQAGPPPARSMLSRFLRWIWSRVG